MWPAEVLTYQLPNGTKRTLVVYRCRDKDLVAFSPVIPMRLASFLGQLTELKEVYDEPQELLSSEEEASLVTPEHLLPHLQVQNQQQSGETDEKSLDKFSATFLAETNGQPEPEIPIVNGFRSKRQVETTSVAQGLTKQPLVAEVQPEIPYLTFPRLSDNDRTLLLQQPDVFRIFELYQRLTRRQVFLKSHQQGKSRWTFWFQGDYGRIKGDTWKSDNRYEAEESAIMEFFYNFDQPAFQFFLRNRKLGPIFRRFELKYTRPKRNTNGYKRRSPFAK